MQSLETGVRGYDLTTLECEEDVLMIRIVQETVLEGAIVVVHRC